MTLELCAPTERYRLGAPLCTVPFGDGWNRTHQFMVILIDFGDCFLLGLQHYHEVGKIVSGKPWLWEYHGSMTCMMGMGQALSMEEIKYWLVVYLPLWKIWVRQLGWVFPTEWENIKYMFQTTNQYLYYYDFNGSPCGKSRGNGFYHSPSCQAIRCPREARNFGPAPNPSQLSPCMIVTLKILACHGKQRCCFLSKIGISQAWYINCCCFYPEKKYMVWVKTCYSHILRE